MARRVESGQQVVSGLKIEADQVFKSAARLTLPIPSGMTVDADARPFLARPETIAGERVLVMVDSLRVSNGQLTTASPPFPGILTFGDYFAILPPVPLSALVTGTVTTAFPDGRTIPVPDALVRAGTGASAKTQRDGSYALYVYPPSLPLVPQLVSISATEPVTRTSVTASVNMTWSTGTIQRYTLNFVLPGGEILADRKPPTLTLSLSGPGVQGSTIGFGSEVTVTVRASDDRALNDGTATLTQDGRSLPLRISGPGVYTATFTAGTVLGLSTLVASIKDTSDNQGSTSRKIQFVDPATRPTPVAGPPEVVEVNPGNGARGVNVFDQILVRFSEPVRTLTDETVRLEKLTDGAPVALLPLAIEPDLLGSTVNLTLTPRANLEFGTPYRLTLTTDIFDLDAEPLGTRLAAEFTTTFTTIPLSLVGTLGAGGNIRAAALLDTGQLVTLDLRAGLQVWDVSDPTTPTPLSAPLFLWSGFPFGYRALAVLPAFTYTDKSGLPVTAPVVAVVGYAGLADQGLMGEFRLVSLESTSAPTIIGRARLGTQSSAVPMALLLHGEHALVASLGAGLQVVDLAKAVEIENAMPLGPALQGRLFEPVVGGHDFGGGLPLLAPVDLIASQKTPSRAYAGERSRGVFELNLGGLPLLSVSLLRPGAVWRLALAEGVPRPAASSAEQGDTTVDLLLIGTMDGLTLLNLTDPSVAPVTLALPFPPFGLTAHGPRGLAFVNGGTAGLLVVDLKNLQPTLLGTANNLGFASGTVVADDRFAYVAASTSGLQIVKYDPFLPTLVFVDAQAYGVVDSADHRAGFRFARAPDTPEEPTRDKQVDGALTDGASLVVVRTTVDPVSHDRRLRFRIRIERVPPPFSVTPPPSTPPTDREVGGLLSYADFTKNAPRELFSLLPTRDPRGTSDPGDTGSTPLPVTVDMDVDVPANQKGVAVALYRPPTTFISEASHAKSSALGGFQDKRTRPIHFVVFAYDRDRERVPAPYAEGADPRATKDFSLQRPPLVLVHGFLSSPAKFDQLQRRLRAEFADFGVSAFTVYTPDYSSKNHSGLDIVLPTIRDGDKDKTRDSIQKAIADARNGVRDRREGEAVFRVPDGRRYAATRVDLVGHSFGGLLTRYYVGQEVGVTDENKFRRPTNYFTGDLNHVITLDTPFLGSAQAEYVWFCDFKSFTFPDGSTTRALLNPDGTLRTDRPLSRRPLRAFREECPDEHPLFSTDNSSFIFNFAKSLGNGVGSSAMTAYRDMVPESPALLAFQNQPRDQTRGPGVHMIAGFTTEPVAQDLLSQNLLSGLINTFGSVYDPATGTFDLIRLLSTDFRNQLLDSTRFDYAAARYYGIAFEAERSDLIVCLDSQQAGVSQFLGINRPFVTTVRGYIHGQAPNDLRVQDRVIQLLNRPVELGEFHDQGMFPYLQPIPVSFPPPRLRCQ